MPVAGTLIEGKYEILAKIKEGGMGTIYKVRHRLLDEVRVVKVMRPQIGSDEELKRRFTQEAKTATRLKHPNVGAILDFSLDRDGMAYIVMEYIDGVNLTELLRTSAPPPLPLILEIAHQALLALGFLHRKNVVHRDVAPDNLMLTRDEDGGPRIKLIDLGIAKPLDNTIDMTSTGVFLGKLKYSSPEQLGGLEAGETLDGRSDLYSLGIVMYELLTGRLPFPGESPRELFAAHLFKDPIPFTVSDPEGRVPEALRVAVRKAIEKERGRRYASAEEFDREIVALRRKLGALQDPEETHRLLKKVRESSGAGFAAVPVTPSAQDRLDRHFLAAETPTTEAGPTTVSEVPPTASGEWDETVAAPMDTTAPRRRLPVAAFVLAGAAVVIAVVLALNRQSRLEPGEPRPAIPVPPTVAAPVAIAVPTATAQETAEAPAVAAPQMEITPPVVEPPADAAAIAERAVAEAADALRAAAETSRASARTARGAAERARAPEVAASLYQSARRKEREGQQNLGSKRYGPAVAAFESATALFRQAESWSRSAPVRSSQRVASIPPTRAPAPEPTRPVPTAVVVAAEPPPRPTPRPTEPPRGRSEEDRVRDAIAQYVEAQNSLDVAMYARIYPSLSGERRRTVESAFANLRSQSLELDVQRIEVTGSRARVTGYERRLAVPRVGSEQRDARERTIELEKRGDSWVITSLR